MFSEETNPVSDPGMNPGEPMTTDTPAMPSETPMPEEQNPAA
jgi:hypothetical protein